MLIRFLEWWFQLLGLLVLYLTGLSRNGLEDRNLRAFIITLGAEVQINRYCKQGIASNNSAFGFQLQLCLVLGGVKSCGCSTETRSVL